MKSKAILVVLTILFIGMWCWFYYAFNNNILDCGRNGESVQMLFASGGATSFIYIFGAVFKLVWDNCED